MRAFLAELGEIAKAVAAALLLSIGLNLFVLQVTDVQQSSMEPTLLDGDKLVMSKLDYRFRPPAVGEIVVFRPPPPACPADASCPHFVKRVVAVAGDVVDLEGGAVVVNGRVLVEPYAGGPTLPEGEGVRYPYVVPAGAVFVLGDNREVSGDSRAWGAVPRDRVRGRAVVAFWPPGRVQSLP